MTIHFEDFAKLDIRIGTVISVERVPDTDKLLRFMVEIGTETRQIIAGMAQFLRDLDEIPGKQIPVLLNIAPRMYRSLESQVMVLAADVDNKPVFLVPERHLPSGIRCR